MSKPKPHAPAAKVALHDKLVATHPRVERKGAANPYTSRNGHMVSFLTKDGKLALRLPPDEREAFLKKYRTKLAVSYDTVMKEYVTVPDSLFRKTSEIRRFFDLSHEYVGSLEPDEARRLTH